MNISDDYITFDINITITSESYYEDTTFNDTTEAPDDPDDKFYEMLFTYDSIVTIAIAAFAALLVTMLYKYVASKRPNKVYDSLNMKHILMSILHACLWELPGFTKDGQIACNILATEVLCSLELAIPFWTLCISLKMFSDLYLFTNGDVFTVKDMTLFTCTSVTVMNIYELFFIYLTDDGTDGLNFSSAIRLTGVLLITTIPVTVFCIIVRSFCTKSDIAKPLGLFFLLHLLVFIFCDLCLALVIIVKTTSQNDSLVYVSTELVYYRMLLEIIWYVGSHFLGQKLRIYNN